MATVRYRYDYEFKACQQPDYWLCEQYLTRKSMCWKLEVGLCQELLTSALFGRVYGQVPVTWGWLASSRTCDYFSMWNLILQQEWLGWSEWLSKETSEVQAWNWHDITSDEFYLPTESYKAHPESVCKKSNSIH